jgi:hypothetical protein
MEYYNRNTGYIAHSTQEQTDQYFSDQHVNMISNKITQILKGVHPDDKNIIVPRETIRSVLFNLYNNNMYNTRDLTDKAIETIVTQIRDEFATIKKNNSLSKWDSIFDGTNGVRQHPPIKLRENRPASMQFMVRY